MTNRLSSLFNEALLPFRQGGMGASDADIASELVPLTYTVSEGDVSIDMMRRFCRGAELGLRPHYEHNHWFDVVGEVNTGINLYYVIETGRLWQVIERRERRKASIIPIVNRLSGPLTRPRPIQTSSKSDAPRILRRAPIPPAPQSLQSFLGEAKAQDLVPAAVFARYIGRVLSTWLDCGPVQRPFPDVTRDPDPRSLERGAVRVTGAIAASADIDLTAPQIHEAWSHDDAGASHA
jgi:hypothetical protein